MRGMCVHRLLALGALTVAAALVAGPVAQAGIDPPPGQAALERQSTQVSSTPDAFERAVLRSQPAIATATDSHQRTATSEPAPYTAAALNALGARWQAYAAWADDSSAGLAASGDSHERSVLPASRQSLASADDGVAWGDVAIGALFGAILVALGGLAAMATRGHGRVPQA